MSAEEAVPFLAREERQSLERQSSEYDLDDDFDPLPPPQQRRRRRVCLVFGILIGSVISFVVVSTAVYFGTGIFAEDTPEQRWISTSESVIDRFFCRWIGICGGTNWLHYHEPPAIGLPEDLHDPIDWTNAWIDPSTSERPEEGWDEAERGKRDIPQYVLKYAPLLYLHPEECYWPSDPAEHLAHSVVRVGEEERLVDGNLSLATLGDLNGVEGGVDGREVYLTSAEDPESRPEWMLSRVSIPGWDPAKNSSPWAAIQAATETSIGDDIIQEGNWVRPKRQLTARLTADNSSSGLRSNAPAILITVEKGDGVLHAFWFFFNSFNEGNSVFGIRFGNHVGDWEHVMVRFLNGHPDEMFLSRHSWGSSFTHDAMEKIGGRPVVYSGNGSHAHYPTAGPQPYVLPFAMLKDDTGRGPLWDPALNFHAYTYEPQPAPASQGSGRFRASALTPRAPTSWLEYAGHWGDRQLALGDPRQYRFFGELHYASGPTGPRDKRLERPLVCEKAVCDVKGALG